MRLVIDLNSGTYFEAAEAVVVDVPDDSPFFDGEDIYEIAKGGTPV